MELNKRTGGLFDYLCIREILRFAQNDNPSICHSERSEESPSPMVNRRRKYIVYSLVMLYSPFSGVQIYGMGSQTVLHHHYTG